MSHGDQSYVVLSKKWRPSRLSEVIGQAPITRVLANSLKMNRIHHAYLFTGTRGVGKTTLARILTKSLNCEAGVSDTPCNRCGPCLHISSGSFIDMTEVDAATNTKVDDMRQLLEHSIYAPVQGRYKVYIIDEVHMLSTSSFNAMLKTLEEPPAHLKFILATTEFHKVPLPIISRCLHLNLKSITPAVIQAHLVTVLQSEGVLYEDRALLLIAQAALGSMRDALSLLEQGISYAGGETLAASHIQTLLGESSLHQIWPLLEAIAQKDVQKAMSISHELLSTGLDVVSIFNSLCALCHELSLIHAGISINNDEATPWAELVHLISPDETQLYYQMILYSKRDLALSHNENAALDILIIRMTLFYIEQPSPIKEPIDQWAKEMTKKEILKQEKHTNILGPQPAPTNNLTLGKQEEPSIKKTSENIKSSKSLSLQEILKKLNLKGALKQFSDTISEVSYQEGVWVIQGTSTSRNLAVICQKKLEDELSKFMQKRITLKWANIPQQQKNTSPTEKNHGNLRKEIGIQRLEETLGFTIEDASIIRTG